MLVWKLIIERMLGVFFLLTLYFTEDNTAADVLPREGTLTKSVKAEIPA